MPLTFAHAAAVLPLRRLGLPLSALAVGSLSPDFVYFATLVPRGGFGHTLPGLFLSCLPASLVVLWAFHRVIKRPLVELLPVAAQRRLGPLLDGSPFDRPLPLVALAILVGAATHIAWDSFTHAGRWGFDHVAWLREPVALGPVDVLGYRLAQHGSTLFGLLLLAGTALLWWRRAPERPVRPILPTRTRWTRLLLMTGGALALGMAYGAAHALGSEAPLLTFAGRFVTSATPAFVVSVLVYGWGRRRHLAASTEQVG